MKDYNILSEETQAKLCDAVREAIANGWEPVGGVSVATVSWTNKRECESGTVWEYNQAMVKN